MRHTRLLAATAVAVVMATGALAATVEVTSITADWVNPVGGGGGTYIDNDGATATIRWPENGPNQSGYDFAHSTTPFQIFANTPFRIGTFTHINQPVPLGSGIDSVDLDLSFTGMIDGVAVGPIGTKLFFDHWETPNNLPCPVLLQPHATQCDDLVTVSILGPQSETFTIGQKKYTISLLGFSTDDGFTFSNQFQSPEGGSNPAGLYAQYTVAVIPLPAAGFLLLGGLGMLGLASRRRRKAA